MSHSLVESQSMSERVYRDFMRSALKSARRHHKLSAVARDIGVAPTTLSTFMHSGPLGPENCAALESWLREHGYWEVEERGTHYLRHGEMAQPEGPEEEPPGMREHAAGYPLVSGAEALARLHDAQAAMWRSGLPTEEKMALEETWLASYVVALQKLGRLPG